MILTVTMNPSVDISYPVESLLIDQVNRCQEVKKTAGGKGLNVTRVIHLMNEPVIATGVLGGVLGTYIEEQQTSHNISHHFSKISGETRNCIAILHDNGKQTEILEGGPIVSETELQAFESVFKEEGHQANVVTISGSLSKGAPTNYYVKLLEQLSDSQTKVVLDTSGASLEAVLESKSKPFAIKPNLEELADLTGQKITLDNGESIRISARELRSLKKTSKNIEA